MAHYTANVKLYFDGTSINTSRGPLAFGVGDTVPDSTVTRDGLATAGLVTSQPDGGTPTPTFPVTVVGQPAAGQIPAWNNSTHQWEPGASPAATYKAAVLPEAFGAVGDGTTNDTVAMQAAHDALDPTYGGEVWLSAGKRYNFTSLNVTKPHVTIGGPGVLYNGTVYVGVQSGYAPVEMNTAIRCDFDRASRSTTVDAISVANSRFVDVLDCRVNNYRALVSFPALTLGVSDEQHSARIRITGCKTPYPGNTGPIDYLVFVNGNTVGGAFSVGDLTVSNNPGVSCNIAHIYSTGGTGALDGLVCTGNTFFFPAYTRQNTDKLSHVLLTVKSDMVVITGNQFFEAGYESINVTDARHLTVTGNGIIWPGQRDLKDAISVTISAAGYTRGSITGNTISYFTKAAVAVYGTGDAAVLSIGPNATLTDTATNTFYYGAALGGAALPSTYNRYTAASGLATLPRLTEAVSEFGGATVDAIGTTATETALRLGVRGHLMSRAKVVTPSGATTIFNLGNATGSTPVYGGLLIVHAQDSGSSTHTAQYVLAISNSSTTQAVTTVSSTGETTGAVAAAPSFTWTIDGSNNLKATPVGSTSGSFTFHGISVGNLRHA